MVIRKLKREEIQQAVELARKVFDYSVRNTFNDEIINGYFDSYVVYDTLIQQYDNSELTFWGAFEQRMMIGMSALSNQGHITMIYVEPNHIGRHVGKKLTRAMRIHARMEYKLPQVTVNAMPAISSAFFRRMGFVDIYAQPLQEPYVPLYVKSIHQVDFEKKEIPRPVFLGVSIGFTMAIFMIGMIYSVYCAFLTF